jgi:hypothetical protein
LQNRQRHSRFLAAILACLALAAPSAARAWSWPVQGPVLQAFDFDELNPKAPGQHRGISIGSPTGTPVLAPVDATVTFAGTVPSGGKTLSLLTAQGLSVTLVHLGSFSVPRGAVVTEGQEVGRVGPSGVSELIVPYVYLGVRRVEDPQGYLDPLLFLPPTQIPPTPVEPPAPSPGPAPAPVASPVQEAPPAEQPSPPRIVLPSSDAPERPLPVRAGEPPLNSATSQHVPAQPATGRASVVDTALLGVHPAEEGGSRQALSTSPPVAQPARLVPAKPAAAQLWLRPRDGWVTPMAPASPRHSAGGSHRVTAWALAALAALALLLLIGRRGRGKGARIIESDALLPDNTDLLRQRKPAHRARVHDDRRGRARPTPQAAR